MYYTKVYLGTCIHIRPTNLYSNSMQIQDSKISTNNSNLNGFSYYIKFFIEVFLNKKKHVCECGSMCLFCVCKPPLLQRFPHEIFCRKQPFANKRRNLQRPKEAFLVLCCSAFSLDEPSVLFYGVTSQQLRYFLPYVVENCVQRQNCVYWSEIRKFMDVHFSK